MKAMKLTVITVGAGLLLVLIGLLMDAETGGVYWDHGPKLAKDNDYVFVEENLNAFKNIDIAANLGDIEILPGDGHAIAARGLGDEWHWDVNGDTLEIRQSGRNSVTFGFNFGSFEENTRKITVYLPPNAAMERVSVFSGSGDLTAEGFNAKEIITEMGLGTAYYNNVTADSLKLDCKSGDLEFTGCGLGNVGATIGLGAFEAESVTINGMNLNCKSGDVSIRGDLRGETVITAGLGSVDIETALPVTDYSYDFRTSLGEVGVNGEDMGVRASDAGSTAANTMDIDAKSGNIDVMFG
jgi:hypothetical protein